MTTPSCAVLIPAAGSGLRLGESQPKAFVDLCGRTVLQRCVDGVHAAGISTIVVAVPADLVVEAQRQVPNARIVVGGAQRSDSVRACLAAIVDDPPEVVAIHDAARSLTPPIVFTRVLEAISTGAEAAVPALPVSDTLKVVDAQSHVTGTVDRNPLRAIQTPQAFTIDTLRRAHASNMDATDDAGLVEAIGTNVTVVQGDSMSFKITTAWDLQIARMLVQSGATA